MIPLLVWSAALVGTPASWAERWVDQLAPPPAVERAFDGTLQVEFTIRGFRADVDRVEKGTAFLVADGVMVTAAHHFAGRAGELFFLSAGAVVLVDPGAGRALRVDRDADMAVFAVEEIPGAPILRLRAGPPPRRSLVWWKCVRGLLAGEWSAGLYLDTIPPAGSLAGRYSRPLHLINTVIGGLHPGCSGAPVLDASGEVVGLVSGFLDGGSMLNVLVVRSEDLAALALEHAL